MTHDTKMEITHILLMAERRLVGKRGPFLIIHKMLNGYMVEWGWVKRHQGMWTVFEHTYGAG